MYGHINSSNKYYIYYKLMCPRYSYAYNNIKHDSTFYDRLYS